MAKKIKGLSKKFGGQIGSIGRKMMVRYVNEDWDFDIEKYIDNVMYKARNEPEVEQIHAQNILDYWKYLFLLAQGNKKRAIECLKESYKQYGPDAMAQMAYYYYTGQEVTILVNRQKAKRLFEEALDRESMFAEYLIAEAIRYKNENNSRELKKAIPYYEQAIEKGVVFARIPLADCYIKTNQKLDQAEILLEKCEGVIATEMLANLRAKRRKRS